MFVLCFAADSASSIVYDKVEAVRCDDQEITLLKLLIEGHHKKTAREMEISIHTVSFHLKNIYCKLQVHSKPEAVAKAPHESII